MTLGLDTYVIIDEYAAYERNNMSDTNDWNDWEHRELHKELAELKVENALLRQDKMRLDWLLGDGGTIYTNRGLGYISLSGNEDYRADIDAAMKGTI